MVLVVIPVTILLLTGIDILDLWQRYLGTRIALPVVDGVLICFGLVLMVATNRLFMTIGNSMLGPWNPPQHLVVQGVYRNVRNPMIAGALLIVLVEVLLAASLPVLVLFVVFLVVNAISIPVVQESELARRFGEDYLAYKHNVLRGFRGEGHIWSCQTLVG